MTEPSGHRPPLDQESLRRAVVRPGAVWRDLTVVSSTASTNADLVAAARREAPEGTVLVAEQQTAGRGRLGRSWQSPARAGLAVSLLVRPGCPDPERGWPPLPVQRYGWLPLLTGLALADAVREVAGVPAVLKWPNDLLVAGRKCAGILADAVPADPGAVRTSAGPAAVVVGVGLNVSLRQDELPRPDATSLALAGSRCLDRDRLLVALLGEFADRYADWRASSGDPAPVRRAYLACCDTVGRRVEVRTPGGNILVGQAVDVDDEGRLVVAHGQTRTAVAAGDVVHVR